MRLAPLAIVAAIALLPGAVRPDTSEPVEVASLPTGMAIAEEPTHAHEPLGEEHEKDPLSFGLLKVGLDTVVRGEPTKHFSFSDFTYAPENQDRRLLPRIRPSLSLAPSPSLNARVEGQWYASYGDVRHGALSLYQAFAEGKLPGERASLKVGRQELVYGSTFLLGADGFFDGSTFDAVKLALEPVDSLSAEVFAGRYVKANSGGTGGQLYGLYGNYAVTDALGIDLYGLLDTASEGTGERTWSIGARLAGNLGERLAFEVEPVLQLGRHVDASREDIRAFGGHVDLTVAPAPRVPAKLLVSYAFGSGDEDPDDGKFRAFRNPNNDTPLIGDTSVVGDLSGLTVVDAAGNEIQASGLHVLTAGTAVDVTKKLNVSLDGHYFRAVATPAGMSKELGFEMNLILTYALTRQVSILASANRFFTGGFFVDATGSGKDVDYGYLQIQSTF